MNIKGLALGLCAGIAITACTENAADTATPQQAIAQTPDQESTQTSQEASTQTPQQVIAQTPEQVTYLSENSGIPEAGLKALKTLDMPVAIPTYMPDYMTFRQLELELTDWGSITYRIVYEGVNEESLEFLCLAIEGTNDGIGDLPSGDRSYDVENEMYGNTTMENGLYGESVIPVLVSNWLGKGMGYYRLAGGSFYDSYSECNDVAVNDAIAITESLRPLP